MTNKDKIKEIRHILTMLDEKKWVDDKMVEDEICRAVELLRTPDKKRRDIERGLTGLYAVRKYLTSLDAIKGLEREGWLVNIYSKPNGSWRCVMDKNGIDLKSPSLPTEQASRLYAVLLTWICDLGGEEIINMRHKGYFCAPQTTENEDE